MLNHGIIKELTASRSKDSSSPSSAITSVKSTHVMGIVMFLVLSAIHSSVQKASQRAFAVRFEAMAGMVQDAFLHETNLKVFTIEEATTTASAIAGKKKKWRRRPDAEATALFQNHMEAARNISRLEYFEWHPIDPSSATKEPCTEKEEHSCLVEHACQNGDLKDHGMNVLEEGKSTVVTEAWAKTMDDKTFVYSSIFAPIFFVDPRSKEDHKSVIGAIVTDIRWNDIFGPVTFQEEHNGLMIDVESTFDQVFTYRVQDGHMHFVDVDVVKDSGLQALTVLSSYSTFMRPETSSNLAPQTGSCSCEYRLRIYPSTELYDAYASTWPRLFLIATVLIVFFISLLFLAYDIYVSRRYHDVSEDLTKCNSVISSLFPEDVLERVVHESIDLINKTDAMELPDDNSQDSSEMVFCQRALISGTEGLLSTTKERPIFNSFPQTTILFMDISGFTSWSCERDAEQVFKLLESVYQYIDRIANQLKVFKVETIGDCYVAATGCPQPQKEHCEIMCRFAYQALSAFIKLTNALEVSLGPGTGDLQLRVGINSGPVIAGVLRAEKARFQVFGDTMNTAARMESTGIPGQIQLSQSSAGLLMAAGKDNWVVQRDSTVAVKGKGVMSTYFLKLSPDGTMLARSSIESDIWGSDMDTSSALLAVTSESEQPLPSTRSKNDRLIKWTSEVLLDLLRQVVARRQAIARRENSDGSMPSSHGCVLPFQQFVSTKTLEDHVTEAVPFAAFESDIEEEDPKEISLSPAVEEQVRAFVASCASLYNDVPFHNFEHATHVLMAANKLLGRIIVPEKGGFESVGRNSLELHDKSFGISSDPLMRFTAISAALCHDAAHLGVTNNELLLLKREMAAMYDGKSVAEQHSLTVSMHVFAEYKYTDLRAALFGDDPSETIRFYKMLTSSVLATDITDKKLQSIRQKRWDEAFQDELQVGHARNRVTLDSFYLEELERVDWHIKNQAGVVSILWLCLVCVSYAIVPENNLERLSGVEQILAAAAFGILAISCWLRLECYIPKMIDPTSQPLSGVEIGVLCIQTIAMITHGLMASGMPTPVLIDPIMGTRVHLLRWCEWAPLTFYIYFITDGVDVPDKAVGLKSKYFFAGCQGVSAFAGFLLPFAPDGTIWALLCFVAVGLFSLLYLHLAYKQKIFSRLQKGSGAADQELYKRAYHSMMFLSTIAKTWAILVGFFFLEMFGAKISPNLAFTRAKGFGMFWQSLFDCAAKLEYVGHIRKIHSGIFDTKARATRQVVESQRLQKLSDKKATVLIEYIMQASDVSHCMQHWGVYQKYNRRLFEERLQAYIKNESQDDPRSGWYEGEISFFDNYIIPLAQKLIDSGCFGVSGYEYLRSAKENREEWKLRGRRITESMTTEFETKLIQKCEPSFLVSNIDSGKRLIGKDLPPAMARRSSALTQSTDTDCSLSSELDDDIADFGSIGSNRGNVSSRGSSGSPVLDANRVIRRRSSKLGMLRGNRSKKSPEA